MNRTTIMKTMFVCAIQSILKQAIAVVMPEARSAMANVAQTDKTGDSILENLSIAKPLVIKLKYFQQLKNGLKAISCTLVHLKRYYSIYRILPFFCFRVAKNLIVFWLLYIYIYIYIAKRFSNPRKESTPCDGDGKRK